MLLRAQCELTTPAQIATDKTRRLVRNEEARFYHHKKLKRLPPRKLNQRR